MYKLVYRDTNGNTQTEHIEDFKIAITVYIIIERCGIDVVMYENVGYELKSDSYWKELYDEYKKEKLFGKM